MGLLDDLSAALSTDDLFLGEMPDRPDACVALTEYGGLPPVNTLTSEVGASKLEYPRVQVRTRATTYAAARARADALLLKLHWLQNTTLNGVRYHLIEALQRPPFFLRKDANSRVEFAFNIQVHRTPSSTST